MAIDLSRPLLIDQDLELVLILPYRLGVRAPMPGPARAAAFPAIASAMNDRVPGFTWRAAELGGDKGQEPSTNFVAARKKVVLLGDTRVGSDDQLLAWIRNVPRMGDLYDVRGARQSIWYYDWGFGAVDLRITLRMRATGASVADGALTALLEIGNNIAFLSRTHLAVFRDWKQVSEGMTRALGAEPFLEDSPDEARAQSGRLPYYLVGLVINAHAGSDEGRHDPNLMRVLPASDVALLADAFTGRGVQLEGSVQWPGVAAVADGFGGVLAVLDGDDSSALEMRARIHWLWRLVAVYIANLEAVARVLSRRTIELFSDAHAETAGTLADLRGDRLGLQALLQECTPLSVCGTPLEKRVYGGIWEAWEGNRLLDDVKEHLEFIRDYVREAADTLAARMQDRLAWILIILNVLTFAAAIATIITTYDWHNEAVHPTTRIGWITGLTVLFGAVTLLVYWDRWRRWMAARRARRTR